MKKVLGLALMFSFTGILLTGCGSEPTVVEDAQQEDSGIDSAQMNEYQQQMESGAAGSSRQNAPK